MPVYLILDACLSDLGCLETLNCIELGRNRLEMERKKRQKKATIEEDTSNLPWEVIYTILSKLPVKSLLRFRCVCKPWRALISEPQFIKSHLTEAIKLDRRRVLCSVYNSVCFYSIDYETSNKSAEQLYFPIKKYHKATILCSCNGIVLLGLDTDKMYVLWNPSTREYKRFLRPYPVQFHSSFCGICYDSSTDNYKVVLVLPDGNDHKYFMVYTFKTNSWSETREFPFLIKYNSQNVVTVNGAPHWVVALEKGHKLEDLGEMHDGSGGHNNNSLTPTDYSSKSSETFSSNSHDHYDEAVRYYWKQSNATHVIVCFDVVEEKFKKVPLPNWIREGTVFDLTTMRGCLSIYVARCNLLQTDVWVMKEYGERNSWTKLITIPRSAVSLNLYSLSPLSLTKNGEVVVLADIFKLLLYNPKENKFRNTTFSTGMDYLSYVDSLVLPKCDKMTKRKQHKQKEKGKGKELE